MVADTKGFRWGVERRLEFVESRLFWEGGVNRSDLIEEFGVSVPQASKDLTLYQEQAPDNIRYDRSQKRYFASNSFRPKFIELDAGAYLDRLTPSASVANERIGGPSNFLSADKLPIPQRQIKPDVLRALLACARGRQSIEICYQSMSTIRPEPQWRRISPRAFGSDGLRWHVRAFCHIDSKFKDFILSRCLDTRAPDPVVSATPPEDRIWNSHFQVVLTPNPRLSASQQSVIAQDFAMEDGGVSVPVRRALLYYFSKRLRLDIADRFDDPREAPVVVKNRMEFDIALAEAMR